MSKQKIPLSKPYFDNSEIESIESVIKSGWVSQGPQVEELEKKISSYVNSDYAVAVNSCTSALHLSLLCLNLKKNDEVLISDVSWPSTGNAVHLVPAKPVLADINSNDFNINLDSVQERITKNTKAIIPVDTFGMPCESDALEDICTDKDITLVVDTACSLGSLYKDNPTGKYGDLSCFSLHAKKIITSGEGGVITLNSENYAKKIRELRSHGMSIEPWALRKKFVIPNFNEAGYNYRLSDINASLANNQFTKIDSIIKKRRKLGKHYVKILEEKGLDLRFQLDTKYTKTNYQSFVVKLNKSGIRNKVIEGLRNEGIGCNLGTYSFSQLPLFSGDCPEGKSFFDNSISLPMYNDMTKQQIEIVCNALQSELKTS